jgi:type II secretory pathway pseudopilin PulG
MPRKGQGATELLVLLAMIAIVGLIIYASSQTTLAESRKLLLVSQARATVNDLSSAASEVYSEGPGAKRRVYIVIPEGSDSARVYVNNTMINIGLSIDSTTSDINTQTNMKLVQGADFPKTPGSYWVPVTAKEGYVLIGNSYLDINPASLSLETSTSNLKESVIVFTNLGATPIEVTLSPQWSYNGTVDLTLNTTSFTLASSGDAAVAYLLVSIQTYSTTSLQQYSGKINVGTNTSETAEINLNVNVVGTQIPTGVSYIIIETFKNSSYSTQTTNFTLPTMVNITGSDWSAGQVTIDIRNPSGSSVSGYPKDETVNESGGFSHAWNPAGATPGTYTVIANQTSDNVSTTLDITVCP